MSTLIKQRRIVDDGWRVIGLPHEPVADPLRTEGDIIVPLAVWRGQQTALLGRQGRTGRLAGGVRGSGSAVFRWADARAGRSTLRQLH